jgi:hypothetical protein
MDVIKNHEFEHQGFTSVSLYLGVRGRGLVLDSQTTVPSRNTTTANETFMALDEVRLRELLFFE